MNDAKIIKRSARFVRAYMKEHENKNFFYHNLTHTEKVVTAVTEIARFYKLNEKEFIICVVSAWFHDIGYYETYRIMNGQEQIKRRNS